MSTQFWKLPFKKTGYPAEVEEISTVGKIVGDIITLSRRYFQIAGTTVEYFDSSVNQYKVASFGDTKDYFIQAQSIDEELTNSLGITVYTKLVLRSGKVTNTILKISYQPFGDVLDPLDFAQNLNPTADVKHNSLLLEENFTCKNAVILDKLTVKSLLVEDAEIIGKLTVGSIKVKEVTIGTGEDKLEYKDGLLVIAGKTFPHIHPSNLTKESTLRILVLNPANFIETIPIGWLQIDPVNLDLVINEVSILKTLNSLKKRLDTLEGVK